MKEFIDNNGGVVPAVVVIILFSNVLLTSLVSIVDFIKDKTASTKDNEASSFLHKCLDGLSKILDFLSANKEHK